MDRKAARNMYSRNNNKTGIQCVCRSYSQGICYDARSYDHKSRMVVYTQEQNEKIIWNFVHFEVIFCDYKSEFTRSDKHNNNNNNNNVGKANYAQAFIGFALPLLLAPRFQDNKHMKVAMLSALRTGHLYLQVNTPGTHFY